MLANPCLHGNHEQVRARGLTWAPELPVPLTRDSMTPTARSSQRSTALSAQGLGLQGHLGPAGQVRPSPTLN